MKANRLWRWRAISSEGGARRGMLWAANREEAYSALMKKGLNPLALGRCSHLPRWQPHHCCEVFRQLATLLQAGLMLTESLEMQARQHPLPHWQALLQRLADDLREGCSFSDALGKWPATFSPLYVSLVKTGELTGKLETCCRQLALQQKNQQRLRAKVKKALRYPLIILGLAAGVVLAMVTLVLPEFAAIYKTFNTPLPALTQAVMGFAAFIQDYAFALFVMLFLSGFTLYGLRQRPRWQRLAQRMLLRLPVMGALARGQKLGQIFTVLSLTQQAGIPFLQGLVSAEETVDSLYWREKLGDVYRHIEGGAPVWSSFQKASVFTPLCIQLIQTGEASGALDVMLENLARHHMDQTFEQADGLAAVLEPLLLIVTGVIIGTLVVAMYLPIFHLGDAMSAG
ncbi:protein transport protein HofC [Enterobacter sp. ECC-175]|uniref:protein transport protein HofC n=1 Tax=unclassified Enterobacter TaxID=2608935 RepID=UPI000D45AA53|nr:protein transport protein HofC [Enterobacter sp. RIT 418]RAU36302.1 type IV pilin biogenesis protein [Enterobacter sp. RIT 418]